MPIIDLEDIMVKLLKLPVIRQLLQGIVRSANDEQVKEIDGLKKEKEDLEKDKQKLSTDLEKYRGAYSQWKAKAESLEREKATLTAQIADKNKEISTQKQAYEQKLTDQRTACEELVNKIQEEKKQALEEQKKTLDGQHLAEMKVKNTELAAKEKELTSIQGDLKESQKRNTKLEHDLKSLNQAYDACRAAKEALESEIRPALRIQALYGSLSAEAREQLSSRYPRTDLLGLVCCGVQERCVELLRDWCRSSFLKGAFLSESDKLCELYTTFFELSHPEVDGQPSYTLESPMQGGDFDARYHEKVERNVSRGKIVKVLLPILRDGTGKIVENALVSVSANHPDDDGFDSMSRISSPHNPESLSRPGKVQTESTSKEDKWISF